MNVNSSVKQERHDEAEIQELAAKMMEANKAKMNSNAQRQLHRPTVGNQSNLLNFLTRNNGKVRTDGAPMASNEDTLSVIDERSQKGQFGWTVLGKLNIPYIFRGEDKYCSVKMVEMKILNKYLSFLHQDIYNCTCIRSYYITEAESRLFNEINFAHCDAQFGCEQFSTRDLIVRLHDAVEFYKFLDACYSKLLNGSSNPLDRCGFIRINNESVVPYTVYNNEKYVPLFYFEGETDNLKLKANKLEGWDLSYLKFCCKVQGIRNELFAHDSCSVISLNDIKNYFPPGTLFEDYWPNKMVDSQLLINGKSQTSMGQWTRQPKAPPVPAAVHPAAASPKTTKVVNNTNHVQPSYPPMTGYYTMPGGQAVYPTQTPPRTSNTAVVRSTYATGTGTSGRQTRPNYYMPQASHPPPLIRSGQSSLGYTPQTTATTANYLVMGDGGVEPTAYRQGSSPQMSKYSPSLTSVRHLNGGMRYPNHPQNHYQDVVDLSSQTNSNQNHTIINQQPAHQQPIHQTPHSASSLQEDRNSLTNGRLSMKSGRLPMDGVGPPLGCIQGSAPYKMKKVPTKGKMIPCINTKPYVHSDYLVTLNELSHHFFNNVPVQSLQQMMQVLGIEIFKANNAQIQVLVENGKCQNVNEIVSMVLIRDVVEFLPQLNYMLMSLFSSEVVAKQQMS